MTGTQLNVPDTVINLPFGFLTVHLWSNNAFFLIMATPLALVLKSDWYICDPHLMCSLSLAVFLMCHTKQTLWAVLQGPLPPSSNYPQRINTPKSKPSELVPYPLSYRTWEVNKLGKLKCCKWLLSVRCPWLAGLVWHLLVIQELSSILLNMHLSVPTEKMNVTP